MSELTEEQQKDLKLEEAKKKYEALKKKNKKKNKAKKETKTEDQDTAETEEQTPEVETANEKESTDEIVATETDGSPALDEGNAPEVAPSAVKEDVATQPTEEQPSKDTEETNQTEEDPATELFGADDSSADPFGSIPGATPEAATDEAVIVAADEKTEETPVVTEEKQEDTEEQKLQEENKAISPKQTSISPKTEPVGNLDQIQSQDQEILPAESAKPATETTDLFGSTTDTQPSFLQVTSEEYKAQISELQTENQTLKNQIESLKTENKDLKFLKFDHLDQIETLQSQIEKLQSDLSRAKTDSSTNIQKNTHNGGNIDEDRVELSPTPTYQQPYFPQLTSRVSVSTSSFDQYRYGQKEAKLTSEEIKSRLSQWKGWNVDMTGWRSIGTGAVVDL